MLSPSHCKSDEVASLSRLPLLSNSPCSPSTRFWLRVLPLASLLTTDSVRLWSEQLLLQAIPTPKPQGAREDDDLRERMQSSTALSRERASCGTSVVSGSSSASVLEALLSGGERRRSHSSSAATIERGSEKVDELALPGLDDLPLSNNRRMKLGRCSSSH